MWELDREAGRWCPNCQQHWGKVALGRDSSGLLFFPSDELIARSRLERARFFRGRRSPPLVSGPISRSSQPSCRAESGPRLGDAQSGSNGHHTKQADARARAPGQGRFPRSRVGLVSWCAGTSQGSTAPGTAQSTQSRALIITLRRRMGAPSDCHPIGPLSIVHPVPRETSIPLILQTIVPPWQVTSS